MTSSSNRVSRPVAGARIHFEEEILTADIGHPGIQLSPRRRSSLALAIFTAAFAQPPRATAIVDWRRTFLDHFLMTSLN